MNRLVFHDLIRRQILHLGYCVMYQQRSLVNPLYYMELPRHYHLHPRAMRLASSATRKAAKGGSDNLEPPLTAIAGDIKKG